jgi:hypothetical protein
MSHEGCARLAQHLLILARARRQHRRQPEPEAGAVRADHHASGMDLLHR